MNLVKIIIFIIAMISASLCCAFDFNFLFNIVKIDREKSLIISFISYIVLVAICIITLIFFM